MCWNECALNLGAPIEMGSEPMRMLTVLLATMAAAILVIALTSDLVEFYLPVIGAVAVLLFTFALELSPSDDDRPAAMRDETERHHW